VSDGAAAPRARAPDCRQCRNFVDNPLEFERALPGFAALCSGFSSVRGDTGLCTQYDMLTVPIAACPAFAPTSKTPEYTAVPASPMKSH
jgi:hypothetical protein